MVSKNKTLRGKRILAVAFLTVVLASVVLTSPACKTKTVYVTVPPSTPVPTISWTTTPQPTLLPTPAVLTLSTVSNFVISGGGYRALPANGVYVQAGHTLTLSWSSDDDLEGYIFTEQQFKNFKPAGIPSGYLAYAKGTNRIISTTVANGDTYYAVVTNRLVLAQAVKLYEAELNER